MKKRLFTLALLLASLQMGLNAQTVAGTKLVVDAETGLEWLMDFDEEGQKIGDYYIILSTPTVTLSGTSVDLPTGVDESENGSSEPIGVNYFFPQSNFRPFVRNNYNGGQRVMTKATCDNIKEFNYTNSSGDNFKGIEYFANLENLTIKANNATNITLDLSKNKKLKTLTFTNGSLSGASNSASIKYLDISNTQLTSITLPNGSQSTLQTFKCDNTPLTSVNFANFPKLSTFTCVGAASLTSVTFPTYPTPQPSGSAVFTIDVTNSGLAGTTLDLTKYKDIVFRSINVKGAKFYMGDGVTPKVSTLVYDATSLEDKSFDASTYTYLNDLTLIGVESLTMKNIVEFRLDVKQSPALTNYTLPADLTNLRKFTFRGENLDASGNPYITHLVIEGLNDNPTDEQLKQTFKAPTQLLYLDIHGSGVEGVLDVTNLTNLIGLDCRFTPITKLDAHGLTNLVNLRIRPQAPNILTPGYTNTENKTSGMNYLGTKKFYSERTKLEEIDVSGCTALQALRLTGVDGDNQDYEYTKIKKLNVSGCSNMKELSCVNSLIESLDVHGCDNLEAISLIQGMMTDSAFIKSGVHSLPKLIKFIAHRNRLTSADFMTVPSDNWTNSKWTEWADGYERTQENVNTLEQLQVNGGSYLVKTYVGPHNVPTLNGGTKSVDYDYTILEGGTYTNTIQSIDLSYLSSNFKRLFCSDNLIRNLDFSNIGPNLTHLQINNNRFTTLDLSPVKAAKVMANNPNWAHNATFRELDVIKGGVKMNDDGTYYTEGADSHCVPGALREDGENDICVLYLPFAYKDMEITDLKISAEDDLYDYEGTNYDATVASNAGKMDIINLKDASDNSVYYMKTHDGEIHKAGDLDLHRKIVRYNYNTEIDRTGTSQPESYGYLQAKIHLEPYVLYMNPATKSGEGVDYYSGTVCVSYEWEVPEGIEVYIASGVVDIEKIIHGGGAEVEQQLNMIKIGEAGDIIPKNTPVYVKTVPAFENVVKADGTTPAKTFSVEGKDLSHVAGFYAMHKNWEPEYLGWSNIKDDAIYQAQLIINKNRKEDNVVQKGKVDPEWLKVNLLRAEFTQDTTPTDAMYYDTFDTTNPENSTLHYSFSAKEVTPFTVLTLGREQKLGTGMIGFWPYRGTTVAAHRCYIAKEDVDAIYESVGSRGMAFHFDTETDVTSAPSIVVKEKRTTGNDAWYTISGMRLQNKPTQPGLYINNGKKVYIK